MRDGTIDRGTGLTSFRRYTWWAVPGTTGFLLVLLIGDWLTGDDVPAWARGLGAAALAVEVVSSVVLLSRRLALLPEADARPGRPPAAWLLAAAAAAVVLGALPLALHEDALWALAPATVVAITATYLPPHRRWPFIAGAVALAPLPGGIMVLAGGDADLMNATLVPAGLLAFSVWMILGPLWAWDTAGRLNEARRLSAELAVKDERLRFAADLHDIQGHHLQVIALKSELAARLAERDPARAAAEMREVQRMSTDALRDTRAVVQGYRRTTLEEEIANATRVLTAAGIDARMAVAPDAAGLDSANRHLLGLVMREATTNVLRHSRARNAEVDYRVTGALSHLRVSNDGADERPAGPPGTGLATLAERLGAAGGELAWDRDGDRFTITAALPATAAR